MGVWGPDIFDDDLPTDMRKTFEDELELGSTVAHATTVVLREYSEALDDVKSDDRQNTDDRSDQRRADEALVSGCSNN